MLGVGRALLHDRATAELLDALDECGTEAIVLKGPVLASWLYGDGTARPYVDSDVLVAPGDLEVAGAALQKLGYELRLDDDLPPELALEPHAQTWVRRQPPLLVDLHWRVTGIGAPADVAWRMLHARTEPVVVAGRPALALDEASRALHVALHVANRRGAERPLEDLARAVAQVPEMIWREAAALAGTLSAVEAFATGLRGLPAGTELADRLDLPAPASAELLLGQQDPVPGAVALLRLQGARGLRARAAVLAAALLPSAGTMEARTPAASRGRGALFAAHGARLRRGALGVPRAWRAVRAAKVEAFRDEPLR